MAEFKLGRIRFVWKSNWTSATRYYKDDVVRDGGNTYICVAGYVSTTYFEDDLAVYWKIVSDGQRWRSSWLTTTHYAVNDLVRYGGNVYICSEAHTSAATQTLGLENDSSKWELYAESFDYRSEWTTETRYRANDLAKYKGIVYVCITSHVSAVSDALGLETDQSKWEVFTAGVNYTADWLPTNRYAVNDLVKYGGSIWICTTHHTSQTALNDDTSKWSQFVDGLEFEDSWNATTGYQPGDFVTYGGYSYIAKVFTQGSKPSEVPSDWDLFSAGFRWMGDWGEDSSLQDYLTGDVIRVNGYTYLCIKTHTNQKPPNATYWEKLNSGIDWKGAWTDAFVYELGDAVRYSNNSYIVVQSHTSDEGTGANRPDQDSAGAYWNLLAAGPEESNLTTQGDLLFYGGAGPARLPIGEKGQSLVVNSAGNAPEWKYWGSIDNIYYVESQFGVDGPAPKYGSNVDQPYKTIRYASEQIERGPLRPNARYLLENNRSFIQDEVIQFIDATYPSLTYDAAKCRRDTGQVLDAAIWDLSHGGNERSRLAAKSYFNADTDAYLADNATETAAGLNYIKTLTDAVLSNLAPTTVRGTLNQVVDATRIEEADAQSILETLVNLSTNAITAGVSTGVPVERKPTNTILVKTGLYNEVLPIIVPELTAVVGDELRSTRIEPASSLVSSADTPYSLDALTRLQAIISNISTNGSVTKTTGNALNQITTTPAGSTAAGTFATELVQQIYDYIDWGVNGASGDSTVPISYGSNTPNTTTDYTYAVEAIEANREFLKAEVLAYIANQYPAYTYDTVACARDISRYIDAIKHDLIYTGNYKSLLSSRYYVNAVNGSLQEDMFYMRNATGLRNCTVAGLTGTLGAANAFGTKRPSAGAFVSLDPGWGPAHTAAWISHRSPYIQNVTTFGTACIGLKVDGDLHDGGNDSIVANDFTQVISDGIGAWVTNLGRAEMVSVFSYYAHISYLAEHGGKIRATNGNSSYGTYGTIAEGIDATETAITGTISNQTFDALVDRVFTDGDDILALEYLNAGVNYTPAATTFALTGEGFGAAVNAIQTVNGGVFEVRLLNTDVSGDGEADIGGDGYLTNENVAQIGTTTSITLSNTDFSTSGQYTGMSIFVISGLGSGQYGYIHSYNSGTKVAQIYKHSTSTAGWDHVSGVAIVTTLDDTTKYRVEPRVTFTAPTSGLYSDTAKGRAYVADDKIVKVTIFDPGNGYSSAPTLTLTDPNNTIDFPHTVRIGDGVLTQPTWTNRGTAYTTAEILVTGDGYADLYQPGEFLRVEGLTSSPVAGSSVTLAGLSNRFFKLVVTRDLIQDGGTGLFSGQLQVSPKLEINEAPEHGVAVALRIRYSQVRLTGHDFLDIGTGNVTNTNYPNTPLLAPVPTQETGEAGGGRVFFTSTDQDGNFRVGDLFSVEQSTGVATLNADAFNISGLQELSLGELSLGGTGATVTEFSTDGTFTADSDAVVPTQKAIRTYIASQIGGGAGTLNVNSITAGQILMSGNTITTVTGIQIDVDKKMNFNAGVDGVPVAMNYFLSS